MPLTAPDEPPAPHRLRPRVAGRKSPPHASPRGGELLRRPVLSPRDRWISGLAGGLGERTGIDPMYVRVAFVALSLAGGVGVLVYLVLWELGVEERQTAPQPLRPPNPQQAVALGLTVMGLLLLLREAGLWFGDGLVWPALLAAVGSAVIWARSDDRGRARWTRVAGMIPGQPVALLRSGKGSFVRAGIGGVLVAGGMAAFLAANDALAAARNVLLAVLVTLTGLVLLLGPWLWQLVRQLTEERRERIRSQERAEMAAHLHDSVLQTLALIQRADSPRDMVTLARGQERELRSWLWTDGRLSDGHTLKDVIEACATRVEQRHDVLVEVVVVGDAPVGERVRALVDACGEAANNAALHAGVDVVTLYVEAEPDGVSAFVTDQGRGFDLDAVPDDRRGIAESILGRMERHGGTGSILTEPGEGTEVHLWVPRDGGDRNGRADPRSGSAADGQTTSPQRDHVRRS